MRFNHLTQSYDYIDGTNVAVEHVDIRPLTMLDLLFILMIRDKQRKEMLWQLV